MAAVSESVTTKRKRLGMWRHCVNDSSAKRKGPYFSPLWRFLKMLHET